MSKVYSSTNGSLVLTPRGTLYRPILGTGPRVSVDPLIDRTVYKTPSTAFAPDTVAQRSNTGTWYQRRTGSTFDSAVGTSLGILGPTSAFIPALAAPVAAVGVGYGIYKAGQALKLW